MLNHLRRQVLEVEVFSNPRYKNVARRERRSGHSIDVRSDVSSIGISVARHDTLGFRYRGNEI